MSTPKAPAKVKRVRADLIYRLTFQGVMKCREGADEVERTYELECNMNDKMVKDGPTYIFKNFIAPKHLPIKYPGYMSLVTYHLIRTACEDEDALESNINLLDRPGLLKYIYEYGLPVIDNLYKDEAELRSAITECLEDQEAFERNQETLQKLRGKAPQDQSEVDELNPIGGTIEVAKTTKKAAPKKASKNPEIDELQAELDAAKAADEAALAAAKEADRKADAEAQKKELGDSELAAGV